MKLSGWHCGKSERGKGGNNLKIMTAFSIWIKFFINVPTKPLWLLSEQDKLQLLRSGECWVRWRGKWNTFVWNEISPVQWGSPCQISLRRLQRKDFSEQRVFELKITIILLLTWLFSLNFRTLAVRPKWKLCFLMDLVAVSAILWAVKVEHLSYIFVFVF